MHIVDINIYRDGGSVEFTINNHGTITHVWLETPFRGEPRKLLINSKAVSPGEAGVRQLLNDIEQWWQTLPDPVRNQTLEKLSHKGAFYNPAPNTLQAINFSRVLRVRDYVMQHYSLP